MVEADSREKLKNLSKLEKDILQCISCGDCREATDYTNNPPKWGVCVAKENSPGFDPYYGRGKMQIIRSLWQGKLDLSKDMANVIYQCPTCNACSSTCYYGINCVKYYEALRADLVEAGCGLDSHQAMNQALQEKLNPYDQDNARKMDWVENLGFDVKRAGVDPADVLYFAGCTAALLPDVQAIAAKTASVLRKLGVDFAVLGDREICCGSVAARTGDRNTFQAIAEKNAALLKETGIKTIVTSCAGCYRTLKIDYPEVLGDWDFEILHSAEFIGKVVEEKGIQLKDLGIRATYHDPCHAGRHVGLYEPPRALLSKIASISEMKTIKESAKCCGAGGGVKKAFPKLALDIAKSRLAEAAATGADYLVSICPFCNRNLSDAAKELGSDMKIKDLIELVDEAID